MRDAAGEGARGEEGEEEEEKADQGGVGGGGGGGLTEGFRFRFRCHLPVERSGRG